MIIGQNGTGKSHLLRLICNALRDGNDLNTRYESTIVKYRLNGKNYTRAFPETGSELAPLLDSIITLSFSVNDKFEFIEGRHSGVSFP